MKVFAASILLIFFLLSIDSSGVYARKENTVIIKQATRYVDFKIKSLDKYNSRFQHQLLKKQKKTASAGYAQFHEHTISCDSISKPSKANTGSIANDLSIRKNETIDSLIEMQSFVQSKSRQSGLYPLHKKLDYRDHMVAAKWIAKPNCFKICNNN